MFQDDSSTKVQTEKEQMDEEVVRVDRRVC